MSHMRSYYLMASYFIRRGVYKSIDTDQRTNEYNKMFWWFDQVSPHPLTPTRW
jgi:hypothetical protein